MYRKIDNTSDSGIESHSDGADGVVAFGCDFTSAPSSVAIRVNQIVTGHRILVMIIDVITGQGILVNKGRNSMLKKGKKKLVISQSDPRVFSIPKVHT